MRFLWTKLFVVAFIFCILAEGSVLPKSVSVEVGEGFLIRLDLDGQVPLQNCQLTRNHKLYFLPPGQNKTHNLPTGETIFSFDFTNPNECGIRVLNVGFASEGVWKLYAIDEGGNEYFGQSDVSVLNQPESCSSSWKHCLNLDRFPCLLSKTDELLEDCKTLSSGRMSETLFSMTKDSTDTSTTDDQNILECIMEEESHFHLTECVIEHVQTKRRFYIQEGLQDIRYSAYKTNFNRKICQFEIPREITEEESGLWIMTMEAMYDGTYPPEIRAKTCKFHLKGNETAEMDRIKSRTSSKILARTTGDTVTIICAKYVPYPIRACFLVTDSDILFSNDLDLLQKGSCKFTVAPGNWTCGFSGPKEEDEDFLQRFEVIKYDSEISDEGVHVVENGTTTIECHLIYKDPIKMCIFLSPSGDYFRPTTDKFASEKFSYFDGGSLSTGDCGITFKEGVEVESGEWKCVIVKKNDKTLSTEIYV